jgi:hypothetical protein
VKPEQIRNALCDLFLNSKHILQFSPERLRPQVMTGFGLNQLGSDPQLFAGLPDASFDNEIGPETLANLPHVDADAFEMESRRPRNHVQPG